MEKSISRPEILIVDDIPESLVALEKILNKLDVDIVRASSGNEALISTLYHDFSLILLDVLMPEMNGYEVAELLKKDEKTDDIPIIFLTAMDKNESQEIKGYSRGAVDFIYKPINEFILTSKIKVLLEMYEMKKIIERTMSQKKAEKPDVLIVDDNPENLLGLEKLLKKLDLNIIKADSGNEALSHTLNNDFALIILDVQMPGMDGFEVAEILKSEDETANIPIIFVTAIDRDTTKEIKGYDRGAVDFIFKPFNDYVLLSKVKIFIEIYKMKAGLEELVAGRTRALKKSNTKLKKEIARKIRAEKALRQSELELTIRNDIANVFLTTPDKDVYGQVLQIILEATESAYGVFGFINENGDLVCPSMTRKVWDECRVHNKEILFPRKSWGGIWKRALTDKKSVCSNQPLAVPEGHIPVYRAVAMPITHLNDVVGLLLVANKLRAYGRKEIRLLEAIAGYIASVLYSRLQRDRKERELRSLRQYLGNIIDSMPSVLVGVDTDIRVTQWNKTAEQVTGITAQDAHGKKLADVFPGMLHWIEGISKSISTRQIKEERKIPRVTENGICFEDVTIYPLAASGVEGAVIRVDDVTEKVRLEEMMVQSEKTMFIGGLAAGMAHEINNPLAGIMQTANVIANRLDENLTIPANLKAAEAAGTTMEAIRGFMDARGIPRMLKTINESGQRVADIVENMLSFARKGDSVFSLNDMAVLLDRTLELAATDYDLKKQYDFKTIKVEKEYDLTLPPVPCEGSKIQQVLLNILRNGAQAMQEVKDNKPLFIIRTRFEKERNMACVEIEDNGPGMDDETCKRAFEPFFTTKPMGVGTGLGLSVSYFIITENHNGELDVKGGAGTGAKFIIRLPLNREERAIHES